MRRRLASRDLGWLVALSLVLACGEVMPAPGERPPAAESGRVCAACAAGPAKTTAAVFVAPTPCQMSESGVPIDTAAARALGFTGLDLVERVFDEPFAWDAGNSFGSGDPASGYTPMTTFHGQTTIAGIEHRVPSLAGCADSLVVTLRLALSTGDGAIAIAGEIWSHVERGTKPPTADGSLDLAAARGTLRLFPKGQQGPVVGRFGVSVRFWPDRVRGSVGVFVMDAGAEGDTFNFIYHPLEGAWPLDDCQAFERPLTPTEPNATPDGRSVSQLRAQLQQLLDAKPMNGRWDGAGPEVGVVAQLGEPSGACMSPGRRLNEGVSVGFRLPLQITSSDGRVRVAKESRGYAAFDANGALVVAWVVIEGDKALAAADLAATSGISGFDLGAVSAGIWRTLIYLVEGGSTGPRGEVSIEGVDLDGKVTGSRGASTGPVTKFEWR